MVTNFSTPSIIAGFEDRKGIGQEICINSGKLEQPPSESQQRNLNSDISSCMELNSANNMDDSGNRFPPKASRKVTSQHLDLGLVRCYAKYNDLPCLSVLENSQIISGCCF